MRDVSLKTEASLKAGILLLGAAAILAPDIGAALAQTEQLIVKARKREESLIRIPLSGGVISTDEIDDIGGLVDNIQIADLLTGVSVDQDGRPEFFIRGAGTGRVPTTDSPTTQLKNGAEIAGGFSGRAFTKQDLFDIKQLEVYRGPQGALYGRNAVGGVMNIITQDPKDFIEYSLLTSFDAKREEYRIEGIYNRPLVKDRLLMRVGVQFEDEDGLYFNEFNNKPQNGVNYIGGRLSLKALISETVDATLVMDYSQQRQDRINTDFFDPALIIGGGDSLPVGGDPFVQAADTQSRLEEDLFNANLRVNIDLPIGVLAFVTGYRHRDFELFSDIDGTFIGGPSISILCSAGLAGPPSTINGRQCEDLRTNKTRIFTQEVRLVSQDDDGFTWVIGADYRQVDTDFDIFRRGRNPVGAPQRNNDTLTVSEAWSVGVFANATYRFFDDLVLSAGLRFSREEKDFTSTVIGLDNPATPVLVRESIGSDAWNFLDPSVSLTYELEEHIVYASWARAHRAGGFNSDDPSGFSDSPFAYDDETADSFEVGAKGTIPSIDADYSLALYWVEYSNILISRRIPANLADVTVIYVENAGDAYVRGVEAEMYGRWEDLPGIGGNMRYRLGAVFSEGKITSGDFDGAELSRVPKWSFNANVSYRRPIRQGLRFFTNLTWALETGGTDDFEPPQTPKDTVNRFNGRIGLEGDNGSRQWQLAFFVDNIPDVSYERRRRNGGLRFNLSDPLTWGVRFTIRAAP